MSMNEELDLQIAADPENEKAQDAPEEQAELAEQEPLTEQAEITEQVEAAEQTAKKKPWLQVPVIISFILVALSLIGYFTYTSFFLREPEGVLWSADYDGATYYFEFDNSNTFKAYVGSVEITSTFEKTKSEGVNQLTVNADVADFYAGIASSYEITGSRILHNQVMTISYGEDYQFTFTQAGKREDVLELPEEFTPNEELLGTWEFTYYGYPIYHVTFNDDGSMKLEFVQDGITYNGIYTVEDGIINFTHYVADSVVSPLEYEIKGDSLTFLGVEFHRYTGEATPDQI